MFKDRKEESTEAAIVGVLTESNSKRTMAHDFAKEHKHTSIADHNQFAHNHSKERFVSMEQGDDHALQANIARKNNDHEGYMNHMSQKYQNDSNASYHAHQEFLHRYHAHTKAGHQLKDFLG